MVQECLSLEKNRSTLDMNGAGKLWSKTREIWEPRRALHQRRRCVRRTDRWHPAKIIMNNLVVLQNIFQHWIKRKRQSGNLRSIYVSGVEAHNAAPIPDARAPKASEEPTDSAAPLGGKHRRGEDPRTDQKSSVVMIRLYHGCCKKAEDENIKIKEIEWGDDCNCIIKQLLGNNIHGKITLSQTHTPTPWHECN